MYKMYMVDTMPNELSCPRVGSAAVSIYVWISSHRRQKCFATLGVRMRVMNCTNALVS